MVDFSAETDANLRRYIPGFENLRDDERRAIEEFSLLWQVFEARRSETNFKVQIARKMGWLGGDSDLLIGKTTDSYKYFQDRYAHSDGHQAKLDELIDELGTNVRPDICRGLVDDAPDGSKLLAQLFICYRLRNNLFHGIKSKYGYEGQLDNFKHAITFLNAVLSQQG